MLQKEAGSKMKISFLKDLLPKVYRINLMNTPNVLIRTKTNTIMSTLSVRKKIRRVQMQKPLNAI